MGIVCFHQVNHGNNTWYPVCMDWGIWNTNYADQACQNMGFSSSLALESIPKSEGLVEQVFYKLNPSSNHLLQFKKTEEDCQQLASIACQEYGKYPFTLLLKRYLL